LDVLEVYKNRMSYTIQFHDRTYQSWDVFLYEEGEKKEKWSFEHFHPHDYALFTNDVFIMDNQSRITITLSPIRSSTCIPAILILHGNKTYGRQYKLEAGQSYVRRRAEMAGGKLLYKCIPNDKTIPPFLVPYEIKKMGFSKVFENMFVTMQFDHWTDKHPRGKLTNVLGPVSNMECFYEYQLYCKSLHTSILSFQKQTLEKIGCQSHDKIVDDMIRRYPTIQDRTNQLIISIDPEHSLDFDDAFSLVTLDKENQTQLLSIYISNVPLWLDNLQLWSHITSRISTIYLPDRKRSMLPDILSDNLCSLKQHVKRVAFVLDLYIRQDTIERMEFKNAIINVSQNYVYEDETMLQSPLYQSLFTTVQSLSKKYVYLPKIEDSHDVVAYLMILMNYYCAKDLLSHKVGIFRTTTTTTTTTTANISVSESIPESVSKFIQITTSSHGQYIDGANHSLEEVRHDALQLDAYIHITSPIRRLVDVLNMIQFQYIHNMVSLSDEAIAFYNHWIQKVDFINTNMRSIRKVQMDAALLHKCFHDPTITDKEYDCYLFNPYNEILRNEYTVYIPELNMMSRVKYNNDNNSNSSESNNDILHKRCKIYLFNNEDTLQRKVRVQLKE